MRAKMLSTAALAIVFAACSDGTGPDSQVSLTFASGAAVGAAAPGMSFSRVAGAPITDGTNTLEITSVQVVLREIELERLEVTDCDVEPEPDGCEKFETGPILINLPVDGTTLQSVSIPITPGTYTEVEFDIHKVSGDDPADAAFLAANPTMDGKSIVVEGTYNGAAFAFETDLNEEQEFDLIPALVIDANTAGTNVTIRLDISTWFADGAGNLFNPATALKGEPNENLAKDNIRASIDAFEDKDSDGDDSDES